MTTIDPCQQVREDASIALLLRKDFPASVADHLNGCAECRVVVDEMQQTVALLPLAASDTGPSNQSDIGVRRLLAAARHRRRHARVVTAIAAAACVLLLAGVWAWLPKTSNAPVSIAATATSAGINGSVSIKQQQAGSSLGLTVQGVPSGTVCNLVISNDAGDQTVAATWRAGYAGSASITAATNQSPHDIASVQLTNAQTGDVLLRFDVT